jgi:hypothetical protein
MISGELLFCSLASAIQYQRYKLGVLCDAFGGREQLCEGKLALRFVYGEMIQKRQVCDGEGERSSRRSNTEVIIGKATLKVKLFSESSGRVSHNVSEILIKRKVVVIVPSLSEINQYAVLRRISSQFLIIIILISK